MFIKEEVINTIVINKSEFICYLKPINDIDEYKDYLNQIKKKHYDATHHCSALILSDTRRSSDDGEPSGTAGVPMLNVLDKNNIENACAIVVRYFGGIKLGAGGLIRAYGEAVSEALKVAPMYELIPMKLYTISVSYDVSAKLDYFLRNNTNVTQVDYATNVNYYFETDKNIDDKISEYTKGLKPTYLKDTFAQRMVQ